MLYQQTDGILNTFVHVLVLYIFARRPLPIALEVGKGRRVKGSSLID